MPGCLSPTWAASVSPRSGNLESLAVHSPVASRLARARWPWVSPRFLVECVQSPEREREDAYACKVEPDPTEPSIQGVGNRSVMGGDREAKRRDDNHQRNAQT
jgi:hypothetical protein